MKKGKFILTASIIALMGMTLIISCKKDNTLTDPQGKKCDPGYEGANCDLEIRTPMLGSYTATDSQALSGDLRTYDAIISTNSKVTVITISNLSEFYSGSEIVTANIIKSGNEISFTIPAQKPDGNVSVSGSGKFNISTKKITIQYGLSWLGSTPDSYTGTWIMK